ncbi:MAG: hypothetical protein JSW39_06745 [Desulfobacterales bacterium]|nr:MAG: hypothetical protein JSW39_06745 [Desulfobacterales bacterium]
MILYDLDNLKPGMILAKPVYNSQNLLLLRAGVRISAQNIGVFKSWGVSRVAVRGQPERNLDRVAKLQNDAREAIAKDLKEKFADVLDDPVMEAIMEAAGRQLQKNRQRRAGADEAT